MTIGELNALSNNEFDLVSWYMRHYGKKLQDIPVKMIKKQAAGLKWSLKVRLENKI